ncbi:Phage major capsid protein [Mycobacterium canetti]|uniref:phage major capsid protein n=1 Tax=Mycobacterium canetti TaxID=78331 RepID=UPI002D7A0B0D|nr:phage major capsid protein [Mycobacterium canetti]WRO42735.1 Phage major capsid protein [Mycobacterium canetti]
MAGTTTGFAPILAPEQVHDLVIRPLITESVAGQVLTSVMTDSHDYRIPVVESDPSASWTAEGAEIVVTDAAVDEVIVTPSKLAGLTVITRELANDSNPAAQDVVGRGIVRDLTRKVDQALFANTTANGPSGLESLAPVNEVQTVTISGSPTGGTFTLAFRGATTGNIAYNAAAATVQTALEGLSTIGAGNVAVSGSAGGPYTCTFVGALAGQPIAEMTAAHALTGGSTPSVGVAETTPGVWGYRVVDNGGAYADIDPFSDALYEAALFNGVISNWVCHPNTAKKLAVLKEESGSNKPLLGPDPTMPGRRQILGVPLLTSPYVTTVDDAVFGISRAYSHLVVREQAEVEADKSVFFTSDRVAVRAIVRLGFGFPAPATIVKITV